MNDLVSIIIPSYNRASKIVKCLESVINQTYTKTEVIVVDDGSTDDTEKIVKSFIEHHALEKTVFYYKQQNSGAPAARNYGFAKSKGKYIVFFDSDDIMLSKRIYQQIISIKREAADCSACGFYYNSEEGEKYIPVLLTQSALKLFINRRIWGSTQSWMYKRTLVESVNGYDETLKCFQDTDITFRIITLEPKIAIVQEPLSIFIEHNNDRITKSWENQKGIFSIEKHHEKVLKYLVENKYLKILKDETLIFSSDVTSKYLKSKKLGTFFSQIQKFFELAKPLNYFCRLYFTGLLIIYSCVVTIKSSS